MNPTLATRIEKLGLSRAKLVVLMQDNTNEQISKMYGISVGSLHAVMKYFNLKSRFGRQDFSQEEIDKIKALGAQEPSLPISEISRITNRSPDAINRILHDRRPANCKDQYIEPQSPEYLRAKFPKPNTSAELALGQRKFENIDIRPRNALAGLRARILARNSGAESRSLVGCPSVLAVGG